MVGAPVRGPVRHRACTGDPGTGDGSTATGPAASLGLRRPVRAVVLTESVTTVLDDVPVAARGHVRVLRVSRAQLLLALPLRLLDVGALGAGLVLEALRLDATPLGVGGLLVGLGPTTVGLGGGAVGLRLRRPGIGVRGRRVRLALTDLALLLCCLSPHLLGLGTIPLELLLLRTPSEHRHEADEQQHHDDGDDDPDPLVVHGASSFAEAAVVTTARAPRYGDHTGMPLETLRSIVKAPIAGPAETRGHPAYLEELTYPCCIPALGEFGEVPPRGVPIAESTGPPTAHQSGPCNDEGPGHPTGALLWRRIGDSNP